MLDLGAMHLGSNELSQRVEVTLAERNMLIGGEPGGGKSVAVQFIAPTAGCPPTAGSFSSTASASNSACGAIAPRNSSDPASRARSTNAPNGKPPLSRSASKHGSKGWCGSGASAPGGHAHRQRHDCITRFVGADCGRNGLEKELRRLRSTQKNGRPNHPQTQSKVDRFQ